MYNNTSSISECKNNGECVINKKTRTSCKACRLRKCLKVGMSKNGSRYGRRSHNFKLICMMQQEQASIEESVETLPGCGPDPYPNVLLQTSQQLLEASQLSRFHDHKVTRKLGETQQHGPCSDDSATSSAWDPEDDLSRSATFLRRPSSHQLPSAFSEEAYFPSNKKRNLTLSSSPVTASIISSPASAHMISQRPNLLGLPVLRPGLTPIYSYPFFVENSSPVQTGGNLLLCSPPVAGVAVEQEQPIDLSKSGSSRCVASSIVRVREDAPLQTGQQPGDQGRNYSGVTSTPLDLTKRPTEMPESERI